MGVGAEVHPPHRRSGLTNMEKSYKFRIYPNRAQEKQINITFGHCRYVYNYFLAQRIATYKESGKSISRYEQSRELTKMRKAEDTKWLSEADRSAYTYALRDLDTAYQNFFRGLKTGRRVGFPKFKSRKSSIPSFYQDNVKIKFTDTHVKLMLVAGKGKASSKRNQKFCRVRLAEHGRIPTDCKYYNPRIKYDGLNWWITVGIEYEDSATIQSNEGIGIDLGIKDLAICSDGNTYKNINKSQKIKKLEKRKRRLQRSISKKYEKNKKGGSYCKTSNIVKSEKELLKLNHRLTNIRQNYLHQTTTEIVKTKPSYIVLEDLNVKGMMKNRHLSKAVQQQCFGEFRRQIEYKSAWNNIPVIIADRFFPSSKLCICCGNIKKDLKLSDRIYKCECGNVIDRDYQAALNLKRYGETVLEQ